MTNQYYFLGTRTTFIRAVPKIFCSVNWALVFLSYFQKGKKKKKMAIHSIGRPLYVFVFTKRIYEGYE